MKISELKKRYDKAIKRKIGIIVNKREYSEQVFEEVEDYLNTNGYTKRPVLNTVKLVEFEPIRKQNEERKEIVYEIE